MNFDLDENQTLFKATVERFVGTFDIMARHRQRALPEAFDVSRWREMADLGLLAIAAPEADGGLGGSDLDCAVVAQALGYGVALEPWLECAYLPAQILQGTAFAEGLLNGGMIAALAQAESATRFALRPNLIATVQKDGDYVLSGEKRFVLGGAAADLFIVTAALAGETALFVVARDAPGVGVRSYDVVDGGRAAILTLKDTVVSKANFIRNGAERLHKAVSQTMLMAAAEMTGLGHRLFDETLAYVKTREQFGQPIGRFQVIQHRMVDGYAACDLMQSALWRMALEGASSAPAIAGGKAFIAERALALGHAAVQLHGGMGMTDELIVSHAHKRVLLLSKLFGDPALGVAQYASVA